jgi:hypothetical protein
MQHIDAVHLIVPESTHLPWQDGSRTSVIEREARGMTASPTYTFTATSEHVMALRADPIEQTRRDLIQAGMAPQLAVAELTYLAKASALAGRPISLQIRGESEAGKSTMLSTVLKMHPQDQIVQALHITFASLMNGAGRSGDFRRCVVAFDEAIEGRKKDEMLMAAIRELSTKERVVRYKEHRGGTQEIELLGPATIIDAMLTDTQMSYQDASRFLVVAVNDDPTAREAICRLNWERYRPVGSLRQQSVQKIAEAHRVFLGSLRDDITVFVPSWLKPTCISARFDSAICGLVCAAAWLNQSNRTIGREQTIEATLADYAYVWELLRNVRVLAPRSELTDTSLRILQKWQHHVRRHGNLPVTTHRLHGICESTMDFSAFSRRVKELRDAGHAFIRSKGSQWATPP